MMLMQYYSIRHIREKAAEKVYSEIGKFSDLKKK